MTPQITTSRLVVPEDAPRAVWMLERGQGPTASEIWAIARGGIKTWRRILEQKMNGSTFGGTKATRAGSAREAALIEEADDFLDEVTPNSALWASLQNERIRATPDATGRLRGKLCVVEVKSHEHGYKGDPFPMDHRAQLVLQRFVLGAELALYGAEVRDEDDMPPMGGAEWQFLPDDEEHRELLAFLLYRAEQFLAWWDAGCPDVDDLHPDVQKALDEWAPAKRALDEAAAAEKTASAALREAIAGNYPHAARFGAIAMGEAGGFQLIPSSTVSIDEARWKTEAPETHAEAQRLRTELAVLEATAKKHYPKTTPKAPSLRFQEVENVD
ncbi:hypothetical protein [Microbacterium sp. MYb62]|uniref:hypothetical protein n=1 Tax=Microbacterium sp. MYb62 TaxID=1848690 RepID=UPI000CFC9C10|nr:hypothetical protein [Microbacterium sp. MYb62]PRB14492.1 hypothetical protein CQ042_11280 [Microbacterium sp. MYb62]